MHLPIGFLPKFWIVFFMLSSLALANEGIYESNLDHSNVSFKIRFLEISEVEGRFENFSSQFQFNPDQNLISDVAIRIKTSSINTGNKKRDLHLKRNDFFDVKRFPEIRFYAKGPMRPGVDKTLSGELTILNKTIPLDLEVTFLGKRLDTWNKENYFFEYKGEISRKEIGLNWNKTLEVGGFVLGDKVQIFGQIQAQVSGQKTVFSRFQIPDSKTMRNREKLNRGEQVELNSPILETSEEEGSISTTSSALENEKNTLIQKEDVLKADFKASTKSKSKSKKSGDVLTESIWQVFSYLVVGFYGFVGAIALALAIQFLNHKEKITQTNFKKFVHESLTDSLSILIIVPYAIAMWAYMFL